MSTIHELQAQALQLSAAERATLVATIIRSLLPEKQLLDSWLDEAERRDRQLGADPDVGIPADEALRTARAALP